MMPNSLKEYVSAARCLQTSAKFLEGGRNITDPVAAATGGGGDEAATMPRRRYDRGRCDRKLRNLYSPTVLPHLYSTPRMELRMTTSYKRI